MASPGAMATRLPASMRRPGRACRWRCPCLRRRRFPLRRGPTSRRGARVIAGRQRIVDQDLGFGRSPDGDGAYLRQRVSVEAVGRHHEDVQPLAFHRSHVAIFDERAARRHLAPLPAHCSQPRNSRQADSAQSAQCDLLSLSFWCARIVQGGLLRCSLASFCRQPPASGAPGLQDLWSSASESAADLQE